jgi:hypothetical protein
MADDHFEPEPQTVQDYLRELRRDVKDIKEQTTMTTGRVTDAFAAGASTAFLTKKQVGGIVAALGVAASIGSGVATLIARAAG